jgi:hypothetical protein
MAAALLAASVIACDDAANETPATVGDTAAQAAAPTTSGVPIDDDGVILDSIPLRSPGGTPARYGWRSGHLVFRYTAGAEGTREVYFTDWGMTERRSDSSKPTKPGPPQYIVVYATPEKFTRLDMLSKTGVTMTNTADDEYLASDSSKTFSLGEIIFRSSGGQRQPDEIINGVPTKVLVMNQGFASIKIWVYQGIIIREQFKSQDGTEYTVEPVSMEFDIDVPPSIFQVPSGFKIEQAKPQDRPGAQQGPPPGAMPPGAMPPGAMPPGAMPPGAAPPGGMTPGAVPPGAMPPLGRPPSGTSPTPPAGPRR